MGEQTVVAVMSKEEAMIRKPTRKTAARRGARKPSAEEQRKAEYVLTLRYGTTRELQALPFPLARHEFLEELARLAAWALDEVNPKRLRESTEVLATMRRRALRLRRHVSPE